MNYRPYPNVARALAQWERGRAPEPSRCPICNHFVSRHALEDGQPVCTRGQGLISCRDCAELWARMPAVAAFMNFGLALRHGTGRHVLAEHPRRAGKTATAVAVVDQAVKAGEHVHVAGRDGVQCAGGDEACSLPRIERGDQVVVEHDGQRRQYEVTDAPVRDRPDGQPADFHLTLRPAAATASPEQCPDCGHAPHAPGSECEAGVDHGPKRWHSCLCLAMPGASKACPPQMDCQGGTLGYSDVWHLRQGRSVRGQNGVTITPDVLAEPPAVQQPPVNRAAAYLAAADTVEAMKEGCGQRKPCASCDAREDAADALRDIARRMATEAQSEVQVWPLRRVLTEVRCGSADWPWEDEWADLDRRHADTGYLDRLEEQIRENGITTPVLIGSDGRLWDGHHRLRIAVRAGIDYVPVEIITPTETQQPAGETAEQTTPGGPR